MIAFLMAFVEHLITACYFSVYNNYTRIRVTMHFWISDIYVRGAGPAPER